MDPGRGTRVELRDPLGMTALLVLLAPGRGAIVAPQAGRAYTWSEAGRELPFAPQDLMALFEGAPPEARPGKAVSPACLAFRWKNAAGGILAEFAPSSEPAPFSRAVLEGPGGATVAVRFEGGKSNAFGPETFSLPDGLSLVAAAPGEILREVTP